MEGTEIRDTETQEPVHWGEIFFTLHKHCGLNKWEIWEYTLPQVAELCKSAEKYIQFEVELMTAPLRMFGGGGGEEVEEDGTVRRKRTFNDEDYTEISEDDIGMLAQALGG
ncbi:MULTISPECIES: hypothetical protein [Paenibacillus]|uniref:hypothetical protein n=1 Tax=Paenibacillus TaxID=44249 RepID=UPI0003E28D41|nr:MULTISPECIES: hypothetical protein [Paenibacillus]UOK61843.1 hypothetical protein MT997_26000 [Paenibacillus sp. OVF10]ETT33352.1 hypothetical protein C161_20077 [Paenibacillus sp. FSL R5-192]MCP1421777.1 hypothetical protein [Paenibacillus xylanexedens]MDQ0655341.1 hypothetical protein [Paenibacillus sp. W2I17]MDT9719507.1 hypothetical protein [Paenibacillus sp. ClWae2A]